MPGRARHRLTKAIVEAILPPESGSVVVGDSDIPGFAVRVSRSPAGVRRSYLYRYRERGGGRNAPHLHVTIGEHGGAWSDPLTGKAGRLTVEVARQEAFRLRGIRNAAGDPRAAYRPAPRPPKPESVAPTFAEFAKRYLAKHANVHKATSTALSDRARLDLHILPHLGALRLDEIGPEHVADLQAALRRRPVLANRCLALVSHIFTKAGAGGRRGNWRVLPPTYPNPCGAVERFEESKRERYLTPDELARIGAALTDLARARPVDAAAIRVLLFTGARPSEILTLRRDQLRLEAGVVMQASKTGPRAIVLPPPAVAELRAVPMAKGDEWAFPDLQRPGRHVSRWVLWQSWKRVRDAAGCPDVRLYDVRHTFASTALAGGASLEFIGGLLGHTKPETTRRYAHLARAAEPMRKVGARAAREIAKALKGTR